MTTQDFRIGAEVQCRDGRCGTLRNVVVDPESNEVIELVVEKGWLLTTDRVVPLEAVEQATPAQISLALGQQELAHLPEYEERPVEVPAPGWDTAKARQAEEGLEDVARYDMSYVPPAVPMVTYAVHEGIPSGGAVIERGMAVTNLQQTLGRVDHVLVDRNQLEITALVVSLDLHAEGRVLPMSAVEDIGQERIVVSTSDEELERLPRYRPRPDDEILADVQAGLEAASWDVRGVQPSVQDGLVHLEGVVDETQAKRGTEALARTVPGVVDVENLLATETAIVAQVTAALAQDPRTDLAVVGVTTQGGRVTLQGQVDSPMVRNAAEETAAQQPGVVEVINRLELQPDSATEHLQYRSVQMQHWSQTRSQEVV